MILFTKPKSSAGQGYLRIDKNLWFYDPSVGKWERRTERERIGGTNSRRSDFDESRLAEEYDPDDEGEEKLGVYTAQKLTLKGKPGLDLAFPIVKFGSTRRRKNILKRQEYALSGRLLRTSYYPKWKKIFSESKKGDIWYPEEIRFYDEVEKANQTLILIKTVDLHALAANLFTKAWLESKRVRRHDFGTRRLRACAVPVVLIASRGAARAQPPTRTRSSAGRRSAERSAPAPTPRGATAAAPTTAHRHGPQDPAAAQTREKLSSATAIGPDVPEEVAPEDPLKIGGQIYLRAQTTALRGQNLGDCRSTRRRSSTCTSTRARTIASAHSCSGA